MTLTCIKPSNRTNVVAFAIILIGSHSFVKKNQYFLCCFSEFAMVAKLGKVQNVKKSELRQALRCKMNSMKFQSSKPAYYQG